MSEDKKADINCSNKNVCMNSLFFLFIFIISFLFIWTALGKQGVYGSFGTTNLASLILVGIMIGLCLIAITYDAIALKHTIGLLKRMASTFIILAFFFAISFILMFLRIIGILDLELVEHLSIMVGMIIFLIRGTRIRADIQNEFFINKLD